MSANLAMLLSKGTSGLGVLGGVVGGSIALAKNLKKRQNGDAISNREIAVDTGKEAVGTGVATAFSAFTVGVVGGGLAVTLGTAFAAAAAGKYAWDYGVDYVEAQLAQDAEAQAADSEPEAEAKEEESA